MIFENLVVRDKKRNMKRSDKLKKDYDKLRIQICAEICILLRKHRDIEVEVEFPEPVKFCDGYDDQDEPQLIESVDENNAFIFHQGNNIGTVPVESLSTSTLLLILEQMEKSFDEAMAFLKESM